MKVLSKQKRHSNQQKNESNPGSCFQIPLVPVDIEASLRENLHCFEVDFALALVRELFEDELRECCSSQTM